MARKRPKKVPSSSANLKRMYYNFVRNYSTRLHLFRRIKINRC
jgi:hypothetical protein